MPVRDRRAFLASPPADLVLVERTFAFWQSAGGVHGTVLWGRPDERDITAMVACWDMHLGSARGKDPVLTDLRALEAVDLLAFQSFVRTFLARNPIWTQLAGPQAMLHDGGLASATVLGGLQIATRGYTLGTFDDVREALTWLGRPELVEPYESLRAGLLGAPDIVRRVRVALDTDEAMPSTAELARRLGVSVRSLQRHLREAGTTLRAVRLEHVVTRVERLLEGTELDLAAIAALVGVGSASRLVALFRHARGTTPGAFRAARASRAAE